MQKIICSSITFLSLLLLTSNVNAYNRGISVTITCNAGLCEPPTSFSAYEYEIYGVTHDGRRQRLGSLNTRYNRNQTLTVQESFPKMGILLNEYVRGKQNTSRQIFTEMFIPAGTVITCNYDINNYPNCSAIAPAAQVPVVVVQSYKKHHNSHAHSKHHRHSKSHSHSKQQWHPGYGNNSGGNQYSGSIGSPPPGNSGGNQYSGTIAGGSTGGGGNQYSGTIGGSSGSSGGNQYSGTVGKSQGTQPNSGYLNSTPETLPSAQPLENSGGNQYR